MFKSFNLTQLKNCVNEIDVKSFKNVVKCILNEFLSILFLLRPL